MRWTLQYSNQAKKFIEQHELQISIRNEFKKFLSKMQGEDVNLDIKRLIDFRGDIYK